MMQTLKHGQLTTANVVPPGASSNNQNDFSNTDNVGTLLQIVTVIIKNGNKSVKTNILLDSGSDVTLIKKDLAPKFILSGDTKVLNIYHAISKISHFKYHQFVIPFKNRI